MRTKPVQILTRRGNTLTEAFPEVVAAIAALKLNAVVDGELVVPNGGRSDFEELRRRAIIQRLRVAESAARRPGTLVVFDALQSPAGICAAGRCSTGRHG